MWHAIKRKKVDRVLGQHDAGAPAAWQKTLGKSEDILTSGVVERLGYLPGSLAIELLLRAAEVRSARRVPVPEDITESLPWPQPGLDDRIEPDWVFVTRSYAFVIEAKWGSGVVPTSTQLQDQANVCRDSWRDRHLVQVALVQSGSVTFVPDSEGLVVTWSGLRQQVLRLLDNMLPGGTRRILSDVLDILNSRGLSMLYLGSLPTIRVEGTIDPFPPPPVALRPLPPLHDALIGPGIDLSW